MMLTARHPSRAASRCRNPAEDLALRRLRSAAGNLWRTDQARLRGTSPRRWPASCSSTADTLNGAPPETRTRSAVLLLATLAMPGVASASPVQFGIAPDTWVIGQLQTVRAIHPVRRERRSTSACRTRPCRAASPTARRTRFSSASRQGLRVLGPHARTASPLAPATPSISANRSASRGFVAGADPTASGRLSRWHEQHDRVR